MKSVMNILAVIFLVGSMTVANAAGDASKLKAEVIQHKGQMIAVHYATVEEGTVTIRIKDAMNGETIYTDWEESSKVAVKKFDLSYLPAGKYLIEISFGKEVVKKKIQL